MMSKRRMARAAAAVAVVGGGVGLGLPAAGLVILDDTPLAEYQAPTPSAAQATGGFTINGNFESSGVLVAPNVVLGASHAAASATPAGRRFVIDGQSYQVASVVRLDGDTDATDGRDTAIFTLTAPVTGVTPATVYRGDADALVGQTAFYSGLGDRGTGSMPPPTAGGGPDGLLLVGQNVIESAGGTFTDGDETVTLPDSILFADFDDGTAAANSLGGADPRRLEMGLAIGDSGGGVFVLNPLTGGYELAALHSLVIGEDFGYGSVSGSTTFTPQDLAAINAVIPEPGTAGLLLVGLGGLMLRRAERGGSARSGG